MRDPFEILGIDRNATIEEVKSLYRSLASHLHPDKTGGNKELETQFKEVTEAYKEIIKIKSNKLLSNGDIFDLLNSFMLNSDENLTRSKKIIYPINVRSKIRISLEDSILGTSITHPISRFIACNKCNGNGYIEDYNKECLCKDKTKNMFQIFTPCKICNGTGNPHTECIECSGSGCSKIDEDVKIDIPKGFAFLNKDEIIVNEKGNIHYGVRAFSDKIITGDLVIRADFPKSEKGVSIKGRDLYLHIKVPFQKILMNDILTIPIFKKMKVKLQVNNQENYILNNEFIENSKINIKVTPIFPSKYLNEEEKNKLSSLIKDLYGESKSIVQPTDI